MDNNEKLFQDFMNIVTKQLVLNESKLTNSRKRDLYKGDENTIIGYIDEISDLVANISEEWSKTPNQFLNGLSPQKHFDKIDDFHEVFNSYKYVSGRFEHKLPDFIIDKLLSFQESYDELLKIVTDKSMLEEEINANILISSLSTIVKFNNNKIILPLLNFMSELKEDKYDYVLENIITTLTEFEKDSITHVLDILENEIKYKNHHIHMLTFLSKVNKLNKSDRIYRCLKSYFNKCEDKVLPALLLADYGDGRAIPALRGYINKNSDSIDKVTLYELKYAIDILGGTL